MTNEELAIKITAEIKDLKKELKKGKKEVEKFSKKGESEFKKFGEAAKKVGDGIKKVGGVIKDGLKVAITAVAACAAAMVAVSESTKEYRAEQAKLVSAFEVAGSSAEQAKTTYNELYRVLGESDTAVEAANHLAKLTTNEKDLSEWTKICEGVYATFGDSLPIEGLTEAANESAKVGKVTGSLADALNWAGISEDDFNKKLAACNTEAEREKLIRETLSGVYDEAAEKYEENAASILAANKAQAKLTESLAKLGEAAQPIVTIFKNFGASLLESLTPGLQMVSEALQNMGKDTEGAGEQLQAGIQSIFDGILSKITEVLPIILTVGTQIIIFLVQGITTALPQVITVITELIPQIVEALVVAIPQITEGLLGALPLLLEGLMLITTSVMEGIAELLPIIVEQIVAIIPLLIETFFANLPMLIEALLSIVVALVEAIPQIIPPLIEALPGLINTIITSLLEGLPLILQAGIQLLMALVEAIPQIIPPLIEALPTIIENTVSTLTENLPLILDAAIELFMALIDAIPEILPELINAIPDIITAIVGALSDALPDIIAGGFDLFMGLVKAIPKVTPKLLKALGKMIGEAIKSIGKLFIDIGTVIGDALGGAIKGAIQAILSGAILLINGFIGAINLAIGVINLIPGVEIGQLGYLETPRLAKGGIVDSATLAMIGEDGKEAVVPLENNTEWIDKLADKLSEKTGGATPIVLNVDGKTFAQTSISSINQLTKQTGKLGLKLQ